MGPSQNLPPGVRRKSDGSLEIPITLDARISIPDYQKGLSHIFKNYSVSSSVSPRPPHRKKPSHNKRDHHHRSRPQKTSEKVAPLETLFDMALLGQLDEAELSTPDRDDTPPPDPIYQLPHRELYAPPKVQPSYHPTQNSPNPSPNQISKLYTAPTPKTLYEPPKLPAYRERTESIGASYSPPSLHYQPPTTEK